MGLEPGVHKRGGKSLISPRKSSRDNKRSNFGVRKRPRLPDGFDERPYEKPATKVSSEGGRLREHPNQRREMER